MIQMTGWLRRKPVTDDEHVERIRKALAFKKGSVFAAIHMFFMVAFMCGTAYFPTFVLTHEGGDELMRFNIRFGLLIGFLAGLGCAGCFCSFAMYLRLRLALQRNEPTAPDGIPKQNRSHEARPTDFTELKLQAIDGLRLTSIGPLILIRSIVLKWGVTAWQRIILTLTASETHRFVAKPLRLDDWRTEQLLVRYYDELRAEPR